MKNKCVDTAGNIENVFLLRNREIYLGIEVFTDAAKDVLVDVVQYRFWRCIQSHLAVT